MMATVGDHWTGGECRNVQKREDLQRSESSGADSMSREGTNSSSEALARRVREFKPMPFVAPCRDLYVSDPFRWLALGWRDLSATPGLSLAWGGCSLLLFGSVVWVAWMLGRWV